MVAELARLAIAVVLEELAGGGIEGVGEDLAPWSVLEGMRQMCSKRRHRGRRTRRGNPSAGSLSCCELLDVLRRGTAGAGFEETAACSVSGNDREHLRGGADFEDREEVGQL
jgi:hypothetical protein